MDAIGSCRRHAPHPLFEGPLIVAEILRDEGTLLLGTGKPRTDENVDNWWRRFTAWPSTGEHDFCGDYAPRQERKGFV